MKKIIWSLLLFAWFGAMASGQQNKVNTQFDLLVNASAQLVFEDDFQEMWPKNWHLDGERARIVQKDGQLEMYAGARPNVDADHAVLWTKATFEGNLKIEYDYTRLDSSKYHCVNIIYIQAQGSGVEPFGKDILRWNELRRIPEMELYFNNMDTYHISYAVTGIESENKPEYIRARRYMPRQNRGLAGTNLQPEYMNTGLFKIGVTYHLTFIKHNTNLYMNVKGGGQDKTFYFDASAFPRINEGRIGLRQMYTRNSRYANFRVYKLVDIPAIP